MLTADPVEAIAVILRLAEGKLTQPELAGWIRQNFDDAESRAIVRTARSLAARQPRASQLQEFAAVLLRCLQLQVLAPNPEQLRLRHGRSCPQTTVLRSRPAQHQGPQFRLKVISVGPGARNLRASRATLRFQNQLMAPVPALPPA